MNYVIFDLEWNRNIKKVNQDCPDEIIEVGAVKINSDNFKQTEFHSYIKPVIYKSVNHIVKKITGISDDLLELGEYFPVVIKEFKKWAGEDCVFMSWSKDDLPILKRNSLYHDNLEDFSYFSSYVDLQYYFVKTMNVDARQISLAKAADLVEILYDAESLHSAISDALLSAEIFKRIFSEDTIKSYYTEGVTVLI